MRTFFDGNGNDSTSAVLAHLAAHRALTVADLYIINTAPSYTGQYLGKQFLLTDYPSQLNWNFKGVFSPAAISRNEVESKIGLEADTLEVTWSPRLTDILADDGSGPPPVTLLTALQGFGAGVFDNGILEVWRCVMPTPGDCNTLGACLMFGGRIGDLEPDRLAVKITVQSRLEVLNVQVPTNVIEPTNILAQYSTGFIPAGAPSSFAVVAGTTVAKVFADASPTMPQGTYDSGYIVFTGGKLAGTYRAVRAQTVESGHHAFYLLEPLPFVPAVSDLLGAFAPIPRDFQGAIDAGQAVAAFPFVPSPVNSAVVIA
jgi:hypothetical protein